MMLAAVFWPSAACLCAGETIPRLAYVVVAAYPHDAEAFTQGLVYANGRLFESTGGYGRSSVREVALQTGRILRSRLLDPELFGEGLTLFRGKLYQLTWREETGLTYEMDDFRVSRRFGYRGEGWGLTHNGEVLIQSDGSAELSIIDPAGYRVKRRIRVTAGGTPVEQLNELEYAAGHLYANVWNTDRIAKIDVASGQVVGWLDLSQILHHAGIGEKPGVLNGIAYLPEKRLFLVTGKNWPRIFLIRILE